MFINLAPVHAAARRSQDSGEIVIARQLASLTETPISENRRYFVSATNLCSEPSFRRMNVGTIATLWLLSHARQLNSRRFKAQGRAAFARRAWFDCQCYA